MFRSKLGWIGLGVVVGVAGARFLGRPQGRKVAKQVLKYGFAVNDAVLGELARAREDFEDLAAEAREEYRQSVERDRVQS